MGEETKIMKHGIVIEISELTLGLSYGSTVDILSESENEYKIQPHGMVLIFNVSKFAIQIAEDIYDYTTNPVTINKHED